MERQHRLRRQRARAHLPGLRLRQSFTPTNQANSTRATSTSAPAPPHCSATTASCSPARTGSCACSRSRAWTATPPSAPHDARRRSPAAPDSRRRRAVHRARRLAPRRAHDGVRRRLRRHRRLRAARRPAAPAVEERQRRHQPDPGRRAALRVRPGRRRDLRLPTRARHDRSPSYPAPPGTGTARSSSTDTSSSPRATPTNAAHRHARYLLCVLAGALVDGQGLVLTAVTRIRVNRTSFVVVSARGLAQVLGLDRASIGIDVALPSLRRAFLGFGLGALCFGCVLLGRGACAFRLDRPASSLLTKLSGPLTTVIVAPTARDARHLSRRAGLPRTMPTTIATIVPVLTIPPSGSPSTTVLLPFGATSKHSPRRR